MDLDYDHKFEEMKKYIPFLDNMIRRLESTSSGSSNPRQAQLDKIRSLRDLLQDKKKRMKMENLLKCEQVLVNLYAKVEQRDNFPDKKELQSKKSLDLEVVRNKLKCVTMMNAPDADTLPEIARSSEMTEMCIPGSKEPALFQRRPNSVTQLPKDSSPIMNRDITTMSSPQSTSRRSYTRVLLSPETSNRRWSSNEPTSSNKLFSRRSPKQSPRRSSPIYHKKERKKISNDTNQSTKKNDVNITLKVPEDSLNSLNTKDILSRIITCSNDDVDIETLRELRTQILGELKQTRANDDISDLILKSYKTKKLGVKEEVEEGELSDSESEAIESIYGSLVVVDKDKSNIVIKNTTEIDQSRKIKICLVINSKEDKKSEPAVKEPQKIFDSSNFDLSNENDSMIKDERKENEGYGKTNINCQKRQSNKTEAVTISRETQDRNYEDNNKVVFVHNNKNKQLKSSEFEESQNIVNVRIEENMNDKANIVKDTNVEDNSSCSENKSYQNQNENSTETVAFKANFYKPLVNDEPNNKDDTVTKEKFNVKQDCSTQSNKTTVAQTSVIPMTNKTDFGNNTQDKSKEKDIELPFLNEPCRTEANVEKDVVSQIDILQALKNEILSGNIDILESESSTPPLHQPKLVKVASAQKIVPNRISIEKYKEKAATVSPLFINNNRFSNSSKEDSIKKQSIKLTEKECERFNFTSNIGLDDVDISSEDDVYKNSDTLDNLYDDLAPKSPDLDDSNDISKTSPIIIPAEPIKAIVVNSKADVDMRTFTTNVSADDNLSNVNSSLDKKQESFINEKTLDKKESYAEKSKLHDPRIRRDFVQPINIEQSTSTDKINRPMINPNISGSILTENITSNTTSTMTSNIPPLMGIVLTPNSKTYENTPSRHVEDITSNNKHVYAPSFSVFEFHNASENSMSKEFIQQWDTETNLRRRKSRWEDSSCNDLYKNDYTNKGPGIEKYNSDRMECPRTPMPSFGWTDSSNPSNIFNILDTPMTPNNCFGRVDCPNTPSHPFGRSEPPLTPSHPFGSIDCSTATPLHLGRIDCPVTPSHPFGRIDCPPTPSNMFGQSECPSTPIYPFGRSECPLTPNHPFGQLEGSTTPSHPFGRLEGSATPSHPFGRLEGSATPSHTFGRFEGSITPSHSFGRSDYSQNTLNRQTSYKDPRLNKNADYNQGTQSVDKERRYYRDRGFKGGSSYNSHNRAYNKAQSYGKYDRDQSIGRNDYNNYYVNESNGNRFYRESRREQSVAHTAKDRESDHPYNGRDGRYSHDKIPYRDRASRDYRAKSVGRVSLTEDQSITRRQNFGMDNKNETNIEKTLSVKAHAGRSFTIDTSVSSTFQDLIQKKGGQMFDYTFDTHRKRASSVGRSLIRESSVSRTILHHSKSKTSYEKLDDNSKNSRYTRARSLNRELITVTNEKSFQAIKDDLKKYQSQIDKKMSNNNNSDSKFKDNYSRLKSSRGDNKPGNSLRSRKDLYETHKDGKGSESKSKSQYSPRRNFRDPRMRGEIDKKAKSNHFHKIRRDEKSSGIVYSNDNIAKGAVLSSGFGVKNYKIPKIKRVTSDNDEKEIVLNDKLEGKKNKENTDVNHDKANDQSCNTVVPNTVDENSTRRITRSSSKISPLKSVVDDIFVKTRKTKKPLVFASESESESLVNENECEDNNAKLSQEVTDISGKESTDINADTKLESNPVFNLEDLDVFSDNIVSDPVIDNINALIADLDNDIDTSKNDLSGGFNKDDTFESMLNIIDSPGTLDVDMKSTQNINEIVNEELNKANETKENSMPEVIESHESITGKTDETVDVSQKTAEKVNTELLNVTQNDICENKSPNSKVSEHKKDMSQLVINNEPIVSTTYADTEKTKLLEEKHLAIHTSEHENDRCSTPDSTINMTEDVLMKSECGSVPDSTNEQKSDVRSDFTNELNTIVTSTNTSGDFHDTDTVKPCTSQPIVPIDTIGSLLSMLQDKSKIKELVSMLGEKIGGNEKLMKKLEKLSEIVSEDEDSDTVKNKVNDAVSIEKEDDVTPNIAYPIEHITKESQTKENSVEFLKSDNESRKLLIKNTLETNLDGQTVTNSIVTIVNKNETKENNTDTMLNETISENRSEENAMKLEEKDLFIDLENVDKVHDKIKLNTDVEIGTHKIPEKVIPKIKKSSKKTKKKFTKTNKVSKITRTLPANAKTVKTTNIKKPSRELLQLQEDIKEMFLNDEILHNSGIRMCRLAKMVDDRNMQKEDTPMQDPKPVVLLKKCKEIEKRDNAAIEKSIRKKPGPKVKSRVPDNNVNVEQESKNQTQNTVKKKATPKNKNKVTQKHGDLDPYAFESDSVDTIHESKDEAEYSSESESISLNSSRSFGSNELLADLTKHPKRKRRSNAWQAGVIKPKHKKKKLQADLSKDHELPTSRAEIDIPDMECFTDKLYCFEKNVSNYSCRLCVYSGNEIVHHYKQQHPHVEIPLSRMNPTSANEAIAQCDIIDFRVIGKIPTDKYVCRFCYKEFGKRKNLMESFFWHIVSTHTGEYKHNCSECENAVNCPLTLDIPPPPKDIKGQLIGYICKKCNFTQISIENLKKHVIVRHNDEKTEVYKINLAVMSKKLLKSIINQETSEPHRVTRSSLMNRQVDDIVNDETNYSDHTNNETSSTLGLHDESPQKQKPDRPRMKSKIAFEIDNDSGTSNLVSNELFTNVKEEKESDFVEMEAKQTNFKYDTDAELGETQNLLDKANASGVSSIHTSDIVECTHFKIHYQNSGSKEYVCCINGEDNHYKTSLLISMKKHIQTKHTEVWDGYCIMCKVIVTSQGSHSFKDCLQHMLDKHIDEFPVFQNSTETVNPQPDIEDTLPKSYINVRPLAQLITNPEVPVAEDTPIPYSKMNSVVSFGTGSVELPRSSPSYPTVKKPIQPEKQYKYEEWQAEVMSNKHRVVLETMMTRDKLVQVYKCAGRFCSFTTDNAEGALLHASTHQRIGGENALICAYCDFDTSGNAIDLVMHVFKVHGRCEYSCALCFYRAAARQLVGAHVERIHKEKPILGSVLRTKTFSMSVTEDSTNLLSREDAVEYYYCAHGLGGSNTETRCVQKSYLPDKFVEHLENKHAPPHPCTICTYKASTPMDLINHMKSHNMNAYQCTWCVHGADNEFELMMHASIYHPTKNPNAYVRVITTKENPSELRILPMASFNKINIPVEDVASNITDDPLREAERSLDLEKLIGSIEIVTRSQLIESDSPTKEIQNLKNVSPVVESDQIRLETEERSKAAPIFHDSSQLLEGKSTNKAKEDASAIKTELDEQKLTLDSADIIYCSDSDDEESRQPVIDLSNDDVVANTPASPIKTCKKIALESLFKCANCKLICPSMIGFKKHVASCRGNTSVKGYKCAHHPCSEMFTNVNNLFKHYVKDHKEENGPNYNCGICNFTNKSLQFLKRHVKYVHLAKNCIVQANMGPTGMTYTIDKRKDLPTRKRKSSSETPKKRRYGPQDVDKLPITPILDDLVYCSLCEFNTKVRLNLVRHLQLHAEQQPVPHTAPVNPVPHLETNEKHFDKMLNLASSSFVNRGTDKARSDTSTSVSLVPPETASRYPKYVPERQRYTCGSKGCAYISLNEDMFRCHWETLHSNTGEYHCVHCLPNQQLDMKTPLNVSLIIGHLKMHDTMLYACPLCPYYHNKRQIVEVHMVNLHGGGQIVVVREDSSTAAPVPAPISAPTMDLKPWQCGLCRFKSMLRPKVTEHCSIVHQSKMQYKCTYCPFRTSTLENVTKHQTNSHPDKNQDVFYYYYREGSVPDEQDGTPLWMKQKQKTNLSGSDVKTEVLDPAIQSPAVSVSAAVAPQFIVDLNIVKSEVNEVDVESEGELSLTDLCKKYGQFCEPNGIMFKCSLCKIVIEGKQAMQSHLYEELKYRRFSCGICSYKAFHLSGLNDHMASEHKRSFQEPVQLPTNLNIEKWVTEHVEYQANLIKINEEKVAKQKLAISKVTAGPSRQSNNEALPECPRHSVDELENMFGEFGTPCDMQFRCPKCNFSDKDEHSMRQHMENELAKIRWSCSLCSTFYQTYHQAQFHCKSVHAGQSARPIEAVRDPNVRASWVSALIQSQKLLIDIPASKPAEEDNFLDTSDNSLLVVRYEERVSTPEDAGRRKRSAPDSDEESLVEEEKQKKNQEIPCPYCKFTTKYPKTLREHVYRHYDLKPYKCSACSFTGHRGTLVNHIERHHRGVSVIMENTPMPDEPPKNLLLEKRKVTKQPRQQSPSLDAYMVCLHCEKSVTEAEIEGHVHENRPPEFAKKGEIVVKCCICLALRLDVKSLQDHHNTNHPDIPVNYSFFKMQCESRYIHHCGHCKSHFKFLRDLKTHHNAIHNSLQLLYSTSTSVLGIGAQEEGSGKRKSEDLSPSVVKRVAKKSTTKLPMHKMVAKKSTTKLPVLVYSDDSDQETKNQESSYGKKPLPIENYTDVTALMPFCGTIMRFAVKNLTEIIPIDPKVIVKDINSDLSGIKK